MPKPKDFNKILLIIFCRFLILCGIIGQVIGNQRLFLRLRKAATCFYISMFDTEPQISAAADAMTDAIATDPTETDALGADALVTYPIHTDVLGTYPLQTNALGTYAVQTGAVDTDMLTTSEMIQESAVPMETVNITTATIETETTSML